MNPLLPIEQMLLLATLVLAASLVLAWRSTRRLGRRARGCALAARVAGLLCLLLIALNPGRWQPPEQERSHRWSVLVDRSASMTLPASGNRSRWTAARELAVGLAGAARSGREVELQAFADGMDAAPTTAAGLAELKPDGKGTDLARALDSLLGSAQAAGRLPTGIVVLTDGRQTVPLTAAGTGAATEEAVGLRARALQVPLYAVVVGEAAAQRDLMVSAGRRQYTGFAGQPLKITAMVGSQGLGELRTVVRLVDESGRQVAEQPVMLPAGGQVRVAFQVTPAAAGYTGYSVVMPPWEGETNTRNNQARTGVLALARKIHVLFVEGVPSWDSKFLAQHLRSQPHLSVTCCYRLTESRYVRLAPGNVKETEITGQVFPDTLEELGANDVVMIGHGAEYILTPARVAVLRQFMTELGGAVIFPRGKPFADAFPELADLAPVTWDKGIDGDFRLAPARDGIENGLFGELLPGAEDPVWARLPPLKHLQGSSQRAAFALVLAEACVPGSSGTAGRVPVVVSRRLGKGMSVCVNLDDFWQWSFFPTVREAGEFYDDFWTALVQWAGTSAEFLPGYEYSLRLSETSVALGQPVRVLVRRRAGPGAAAPQLEVWRDQQRVQELRPGAVAGEATDRWEALLNLTEPGLYRLVLAPAAGAGAAAGPCATLLVRERALELDESQPDPAFVARLTELAGGRVIAPGALATLMDETEKAHAAPQSAPATAVWIPWWPRLALLLVALGAFAAEWTLRRRNGLV